VLGLKFVASAKVCPLDTHRACDNVLI
jgi:hypothetical protein